MRSEQEAASSGPSEIDATMQRYVVGELERWAGKYDIATTRVRIEQLMHQGFDAMFDGTHAFSAVVEAPAWVATVTPKGILVKERAAEPLAHLPGGVDERFTALLRMSQLEPFIEGVRTLLRTNAGLSPEQAAVIVDAANKRLGFAPADAVAQGTGMRGSVRGDRWMALFYAKGFDLLPTAEYEPQGSEAVHAARTFAAQMRTYLEGAGEHVDWDWLRKVVAQNTSALGIKRPPRVEALYMPSLTVMVGPLRKVSMYGPHILLQERAHEDAPWRESHNAV